MEKCRCGFSFSEFCYTDELAKTFWQSAVCFGALGEHQRSSSGCYSAVPLKDFQRRAALVDTAYKQFQRNLLYLFIRLP